MTDITGGELAATIATTYYNSAQDMDDYMSSFGVISFTDHDEDGASDARTVDKARRKAKSEIDVALGQKHDAAALATSDNINEWATILACYFACMYRCNAPPDSLAMEFERIMAPETGLLARVAASNLSLPGLAELATNVPTWSNIQVDRRYYREKQRVVDATSTPVSTSLEHDAVNEVDFGE